MEFITKETIRERQLASDKIVKKTISILNEPEGEMILKKTGVGVNYDATHVLYKKLKEIPKGEMTLAEVKEFVKKAVITIDEAEREHPTLYQEIYDIIKDPNFPETIEVNDLIGVQAAFAVVNEGEAVNQADFKIKKLQMVKIQTLAVGFIISQKWLDFNQLWKITQANKAIGEAYNTTLDHMHLSPIIKGTYTFGSITNKVTTGKSDLENVWLSLRRGIKGALKRTDSHGYKIKPTIALCNSATAMDVEAAVKGLLQSGSQLGELGQIKKVIAYDGWSGVVNGVMHNYDAPKDGEVFLISPKRYFKSLVKAERTRIEQKGNILNLSALEVSEYFYRGVIAGISNSVQKVLVS
ncbi:MAG: hypothetical protein CR988_02365 [Treponema sp.]|nr:MAG: hypothetical protein CR988_02365 [Treponema sp.]